MENKIKTILFDYGGTLDTNGIHWSENFYRAYRHFNINVERKDFRDAFIYSERKIGSIIKPDFSLKKTYEIQLYYQIEYLESTGLPAGKYYKMVEDISNYCLEKVLNNVETVKNILKSLSKKYNLGLISNYYGNVETVLKETGLHKYFSAVIDSAAAGIRKPDKRIFELAFERLKAVPYETVVTGDSYDNDIFPAKKLGCTTVWLNVKSWKKQEDISSADIIIKSVTELPQVLIDIKNLIIIRSKEKIIC
jgi:HAD superfamily hydrolase (TIGR01549 family)